MESCHFRRKGSPCEIYFNRKNLFFLFTFAQEDAILSFITSPIHLFSIFFLSTFSVLGKGHLTRDKALTCTLNGEGQIINQQICNDTFVDFHSAPNEIT